MAFEWRDLGVDPVIYLSAGNALLRAAMEAFGGLPFKVVVDGAAPEDAPRNFLGLTGVARAELLERTTLAIHEGDAGLAEDCARAGVPQLLYPPDAEGERLAAAVEEHGAGLRLREGDLEGGRLREVAGRVMADPKYTRAAMEISESWGKSKSAAPRRPSA